MPNIDDMSFKPSLEDMAMRAPIAYIQHFLTLFDDISASAALVQDPEHPQTLFVAKSPWEAVSWARKFLSANEWSQVSGLTLGSCQEEAKKIGAESHIHSGDDEILTASKPQFQTRNLRRARETPNSDISDTLQIEPKPKQQRTLSTRNESSDDQLITKCQSSKVVARQRRHKPNACHQNKLLCGSTDDDSDEGTGTGSKLGFSDVDDAVPSPIPEIQGGVLAGVLIPVAPSPQDSSFGESGPDRQGPRAELEKLECITSIQVSPHHRRAIVQESLALGNCGTLENFRLACFYWRKHHMPVNWQALAVDRPAAIQGSRHTYEPSSKRHSALDQFSRAYHAAQTTIMHRALLDVLYQADLAHLHEVYLGTLEALAPFVSQERHLAGSRPLELFDKELRDCALDLMYWACYPDLHGKPRLHNKILARKFKVKLRNAERWYTLRAKFSIGLLALVPRGSNSWFEKLPLKDLSIYLRLIAVVNPIAIEMAEMISGRVLSLWRREELSRPFLRLDYLDTVDKMSFDANPSKLLEEISVG